MIQISLWDWAGALTGVLALMALFAIGSFMYWGYNIYQIEKQALCDWETHVNGVPGLVDNASQ